MKKVFGVYSVFCLYWVGDGFLVCLLFFYIMYGQYLSFFLLLDYVGLYWFEFIDQCCGVGQYLYCGFEMVIIVYEGELEYYDFIGVGGYIGVGDVQWMIVGVGILYEEYYVLLFVCSGGMLDMVQLWVNLLVVDKMVMLGYQILFDCDILWIVLFDGVGIVWVIVGSFEGYVGFVWIFMLMDVWDLCFKQGYQMLLEVVVGCILVLVVFKGSVIVNDQQVVYEVQLVIFDCDG